MGGGGAGVGVNRALLVRVESWLEAQPNKGGARPDVQACASALRGRHREYQRKPAGPFARCVARAVELLEAQHGAPRRQPSGGKAGGGGDTGSDSDSDDSDDSANRGGEASSSDAELDDDVPEAARNMLNASLYAAPAAAAAGARQQAAFAAPEAVEAAAKRALGLEAEQQLQQQQAATAAKRRASPSAAAAAAAKRYRAAKRQSGGGAGQGGGSGGGGDSSLASPSPTGGARLADMGGIEKELQAIRELVLYPLAHPEVYAWLGVSPPRGVLLHGPPGTGKTMLACAIAAEAGVPFFRVNAPEVVSGMSGESEAKIRELFEAAKRAAPSIVFIDEIDVIAPKRESAAREMERRIVAQMLTCMDALGTDFDAVRNDQAGEGDEDASAAPPKTVIVIGASNRPDALDSALRRAGRFDREIMLGVPDEAARLRILQRVTSRVRLGGELDLAHIARRSPGYVGADLQALAKEAAAVALARVFDQLEQRGAGIAASDADGDGDMEVDGGDKAGDAGAGITAVRAEPLSAAELSGVAIVAADFEAALGRVQPSATREGFATVPDVTWEQVGAMGSVREELDFAVARPIRQPELFAAMGLRVGGGCLLYGPPGCGKTLAAKAVANECQANFISIKGPELLNKFVGESERAVRAIFARARASSPCILFFDELDSLAPRRGADGNAAAERVVNQLLTEMDGFDKHAAVYCLGATNRPDMIDPALLRPGRLDKLLFVPLPRAQERASIAHALTREMPLAEGADVGAVASSDACDGFSGADMAALVREACVQAIRAAPLAGVAAAEVVPRVTMANLREAARRVTPSVSKRDAKRYERLASSFSRGSVGNAAGGAEGGAEGDTAGGAAAGEQRDGTEAAS